MQEVHWSLCSMWLVQTSDSVFLKRRANVTTKVWNDRTCNALLKRGLTETVTRVHQEERTRGKWPVSDQEGSDNASSLDTGVALEVEEIIENAC